MLRLPFRHYCRSSCVNRLLGLTSVDHQAIKERDTNDHLSPQKLITRARRADRLISRRHGHRRPRAVGDSRTDRSLSGDVVRDPQALALLAKAQAALAGTPASITDVTVQANVHWVSGSDDQNVSATFLSAGPETSQATFNLASGPFVEGRNQLAASFTKNGVTLAIAPHNALNMHEWFFPQFFVNDLLQTNGYALGTPVQAANGETQIAIQGSVIPSNVLDAGTAQILSNASQFDLLLDGTTFLPVSLSFTAHPDDDALRGFPIVYTFSQYQTQNGVRQPFHIQKFVQGTLTLDVVVQSFTVNGGLSAAQWGHQ